MKLIHNFFQNILTYLFIITIMSSLNAFADLQLASPEKLVEQASQGRQQLRDVVLSIQQQLPEMRDYATFEGYYLTLDQLNIYSNQFNLNDIYPDAIYSLGRKMSLFSIKWVDLSKMENDKLKYYLKWFDLESFNFLLATTNFIIPSIDRSDYPRFKILALNLKYLLENYYDTFKIRPDIGMGYKEMISSIAVNLLQNPDTNSEEYDFWFDKIYTANGINYYLDYIQKEIFSISSIQPQNVKTNYIHLIKVHQKFISLSDYRPTWINDKISELSIELFKKAFELNQIFTEKEYQSLIQNFGPKHLQSLVFSLVSIPESYLIENSQNIESIYSVLNEYLNKFNLNSESIQLDSFVGKTLAALKITSLGLEGTYKVTDSHGKKWNFTLISTRPLELAAALADEKWMVFKNFFSIRYNPADQTYIGMYSQYESDVSLAKPVIRFSFKNLNRNNKEIQISDEYAMPDFIQNKGLMSENIISLKYGKKLNSAFTRTLKGSIKFKLGNNNKNVDLIIQSNGPLISARLQDHLGIIYSFNQGFVNSDGTLVLNTNLLQNTTWAQLRGKLTETGLVGKIIIGGRGISTDEFILK